jgi:hypothetical protein
MGLERRKSRSNESGNFTETFSVIGGDESMLVARKNWNRLRGKREAGRVRVMEQGLVARR